jgi:aminoglycoside phosphotransferase (APT) family kinase protein
VVDLAAVSARLGRPVSPCPGGVAGASKHTVRVLVAGRPAYLATGPTGPALPGAHDIGREHRFLAALASTPVPVPEVLDCCEDASVAGAPYLLSAEVPGRLVTGEPPWRGDAGALAASALDTLADLHAVDPADVGIEGPPGRYLERQVRRWRGQLARTPTAGRLGDLDALARWLSGHLPASEERRIVHGDYGFHNLLVDGDRVVAVLDWELATVGDPLADLAFFVKSWGPGALSANPAQDAVALRPGAPDRAGLEARYEQRSGRSLGPTRAFYDVFALWRSIGIQEGVHARSGGRLLVDEVPAMVATARRLAGLT